MSPFPPVSPGVFIRASDWSTVTPWENQGDGKSNHMQNFLSPTRSSLVGRYFIPCVGLEKKKNQPQN